MIPSTNDPCQAKNALFFALCLGVFLVPASLLASEPTYWKDVRPILRKSCTVCHNPRQLKEPEVSGGLTLDTYDAVLSWKEKNKALVVHGKSGDSLLYKVVISDDPDKRMPLGSPPLPSEVTAILKKWIDAGAKEGEKPAEVEAPLVRTGPRRKLDVLLPTAVTPDKSAFAGLPRGPVTLSLKVGPLSPVTALAFAPKEKLLAAGAYGRVTLWDLTTGKPARVLTSVLGAVNDLRFSPDGKWLAAAGGQPSAKGDLRLFAVADGKLKATYAGHDDVIGSVAFRPDGLKLATASYDGTARIWDVASARAEQTLTMHSDFVTAVGWSPDGKHLYSGSKDRSVRMVESATGKGVFTFSDRNEDVLALAVSGDGKSVVVTGLEPGLTWWSTETGAKLRTMAGHRGAVHELAFSSDGKQLVSAGSDGTLKVWNGATGILVRTITPGSLVYAAAITSDGKLIAAGSFDGLVRVYDGAGTQLLTLLSLPPEKTREDWLVLTPAGYHAGNKELLDQTAWTMANRQLPQATVNKTLLRPELVTRSLKGESLPAPVFEK